MTSTTDSTVMRHCGCVWELSEEEVRIVSPCAEHAPSFKILIFPVPTEMEPAEAVAAWYETHQAEDRTS